MKKGQGWAKRVTLENLSSFRNFLRSAEDREASQNNFAEKVKSKLSKSKAISPFQGLALKFPNRFSKTLKPPGIHKKQKHKTKQVGSSNPNAAVGSRGRLLWRKTLSASDVQKPPNAKSKITGCLRLVQAPRDNVEKNDQETWFRKSVFKNADWEIVSRKPFEERTEVSFIIKINGKQLQAQKLELRFKPARAAQQSNYTTSLHWGSLINMIRKEVPVGKMFELYAPAQRSQAPFFIEIA